MSDKLKEKIKNNIDLFNKIDFDYIIVPLQKPNIDFGIVNLDTAKIFGVNIKKQGIRLKKFKTHEKGFFRGCVDNVLLLN